MTATASELAREIAATLDGQDGDWDIAAITATLWGAGHHHLTDIPEAEFWRTVFAHPRPDPADEPRRFRSDLSAKIVTTRADRDAIWTDGTVTVRARGVSRVNQELPQPLAEIVVESPFDEVAVRDTDWDGLWAKVCEVRDDAAQARAMLSTRLRAAAHHHQAVESRLQTALRERDAAIRAALDAGMSASDVAANAGLSEPMVYKVARQL